MTGAAGVLRPSVGLLAEMFPLHTRTHFPRAANSAHAFFQNRTFSDAEIDFSRNSVRKGGNVRLVVFSSDIGRTFSDIPRTFSDAKQPNRKGCEEIGVCRDPVSRFCDAPASCETIRQDMPRSGAQATKSLETDCLRDAGAPRGEVHERPGGPRPGRWKCIRREAAGTGVPALQTARLGQSPSREDLPFFVSSCLRVKKRALRQTRHPFLVELHIRVVVGEAHSYRVVYGDANEGLAGQRAHAFFPIF